MPERLGMSCAKSVKSRGNDMLKVRLKIKVPHGFKIMKNGRDLISRKYIDIQQASDFGSAYYHLNNMLACVDVVPTIEVNKGFGTIYNSESLVKSVKEKIYQKFFLMSTEDMLYFEYSMCGLNIGNSFCYIEVSVIKI